MQKPWEKELKIPIKELINDLELEISYKEEVSYMILGILKSNFPGERRVPLLPEDINDFANELILEEGFGEMLDIEDNAYKEVGCLIASRAEVFAKSDAIFSLKLLQPVDYPSIKVGQLIIGWTHPYGSGKNFMNDQAFPKDLVVVDLDNNFPGIFYKNKVISANIPKGLFYRNSFYAGLAGVIHAFTSYGFLPDNETKIAILGSGNVSQGAFNSASKFSSNIRMFYRNTMPVFKKNFRDYDIIINGIEVGTENDPILSLLEQSQLKKGTLIIDVAADAGNAIQGSHFTEIDHPIYKEKGLYYYVVPNVPSIFYRNISQLLSKVLSEHIFRKDVVVFNEIKERRK